jgi:hypothetical protein
MINIIEKREKNALTIAMRSHRVKMLQERGSPSYDENTEEKPKERNLL